MLVADAGIEGDNAMWKERAVSLLSSLMPALTWKRDNQDDAAFGVIRDHLTMQQCDQDVSATPAVPDRVIRAGLQRLS
jgi:intracellular multiplication protein IcmO